MTNSSRLMYKNFICTNGAGARIIQNSLMCSALFLNHSAIISSLRQSSNDFSINNEPHEMLTTCCTDFETHNLRPSPTKQPRKPLAQHKRVLKKKNRMMTLKIRRQQIFCVSAGDLPQFLWQRPRRLPPGHRSCRWGRPPRRHRRPTVSRFASPWRTLSTGETGMFSRSDIRHSRVSDGMVRAGTGPVEGKRGNLLFFA